MIPTKEWANMSVSALAAAIETHHQEMALLYEAMSAKMSKQTVGEAFLSDEHINNSISNPKTAVQLQK